MAVEQQQHQAQRHAQEQLQAEKQAEQQAQLQQLAQKQAQWQAQEQAQYSAEEWARWQATWDPADDPKYVSLLKIQNKLNFMHRIPIPSLSSYPDGLTCLERISWEVERMMELLRVQNMQAFDELHRGIGMIGKKDGRAFYIPPTATTGPLSLELRSQPSTSSTSPASHSRANPGTTYHTSWTTNDIRVSRG